MPPKNAAKAKAKGAANSVEGTPNPTPRQAQMKRSKEAQSHEESIELGHKLFNLVDTDGGGQIQFSEFVELHHNMLRGLTDESVGEQMTDLAWQTDHNLEKQFRDLDTNHNLTLDVDEWQVYIDSMIKLFGMRAFCTVVENMVGDHHKKQQKAAFGGLDDEALIAEHITSEKLLSKVLRLDYLNKTHIIATEDLLHQKADPNFVERKNDPLGGSILYHVAQKCEPSFMLKLLALGGDGNQMNDNLDSGVLNAARHRRLEVLRVLVTEDDPHHHAQYPDETPEADLSKSLVAEMSEMSTTELRNLVMRGADINYRNTSGWTPLNSAVFFGRLDCVEALIRLAQTSIKHRLYIDMRNAKHRSPLHIAARKGFDAAVKVLVNGRADVDARDMDGWTPLHHAVFNSNDEAVKILLNEGPHAVHTKGLRGFTPYLLHQSPYTSSKLHPDTFLLLRPADGILVAKKIIPILNDKDLSIYDKLHELLTIPGVHHRFENLRLYDQIFDPCKGPNKTQLSKLWHNLCKDLVVRLKSGECDVDQRQFSDGDPALEEEKANRRKEQAEFLESWLYESAGPPRSNEWAFDNREGYHEDLTETVNKEIQGFKQWFDWSYESLKEVPGGGELLNLPVNEVLLEGYETQQGAHPILSWLDPPQSVPAFQALRTVNALGVRGHDEMEEALVHFMDLLTTNSSFQTPQLFWTNVYKLWLTKCAQVMEPMWQQKVRNLVVSFREMYAKEGFSVEFRQAPPKSFEQMAATEKGAGFSTYDERTKASVNCDALRCTLIAKTPEAAVALVGFIKEKSLTRDKMELVRIRNEFHIDFKSSDGYREVVLNVVFNAGEQNMPGVKNKVINLSLVAEMRIALPEFLQHKKGMSILRKFITGKMESKIVGQEANTGQGGVVT